MLIFCTTSSCRPLSAPWLSKIFRRPGYPWITTMSGSRGKPCPLFCLTQRRYSVFTCEFSWFFLVHPQEHGTCPVMKKALLVNVWFKCSWLPEWLRLHNNTCFLSSVPRATELGGLVGLVQFPSELRTLQAPATVPGDGLRCPEAQHLQRRTALSVSRLGWGHRDRPHREGREMWEEGLKRVHRKYYGGFLSRM